VINAKRKSLTSEILGRRYGRAKSRPERPWLALKVCPGSFGEVCIVEAVEESWSSGGMMQLIEILDRIEPRFRMLIRGNCDQGRNCFHLCESGGGALSYSIVCVTVSQHR